MLQQPDEMLRPSWIGWHPGGFLWPLSFLWFEGLSGIILAGSQNVILGGFVAVVVVKWRCHRQFIGWGDWVWEEKGDLEEEVVVLLM